MSLAPARSFRWAPRWDCSEDSILFDSNSGDYWVLSAEGRAALESLQTQGSVERGVLLASLHGSVSDAEALLDGLTRAQLIVAVVDGQPAPLDWRDRRGGDE